MEVSLRKDQKGFHKRGIHDQGELWQDLLEIAEGKSLKCYLADQPQEFLGPEVSWGVSLRVPPPLFFDKVINSEKLL